MLGGADTRTHEDSTGPWTVRVRGWHSVHPEFGRGPSEDDERDDAVSACVVRVRVPSTHGLLVAPIITGYAFPLNPAWILRDEGWYDVYKALKASAECAQALDAWLPPESGLRERIDRVHEAHPRGFVLASTLRTSAEAGEGLPSEALRQLRPAQMAEGGDLTACGSRTPRTFERPGEEAYERADLALRRHLAMRRAKLKMRALLLWAAGQEECNLFAAPVTRRTAPTPCSEALRRSMRLGQLFQQVLRRGPKLSGRVRPTRRSEPSK